MILLKLISLCLLCNTYKADDKKNIVELKDQNFDTELTKHDVGVVMFYAPWCPYSKELQPIYSSAAEELTKSKSPITLMEMNCADGGKKTCQTKNIVGYPTVNLYHKGKFVEEYTGDREQDKIVKYIKAQSDRSSRDVKIIGKIVPLSSKSFPHQQGRIDMKRDIDNLKLLLNNDFPSTMYSYLPNIDQNTDTSNNNVAVKEVTGSSFKSIVENNGKDTIIEFFAPWCPHCKELAPIFNELGEKLKSEDVDVVKMDVTANEVPYPYVVNGYPTLYWVGKNTKYAPVQYEGSRDIEDLLRYVAEHSTNELKNFDRLGNLKISKTN